jgi:hypothetical protein
MNPDEIQEHYDALHAKCNGDLLKLSNDEIAELRACAANYYQQTGEALAAQFSIYS